MDSPQQIQPPPKVIFRVSQWPLKYKRVVDGRKVKGMVINGIHYLWLFRLDMLVDAREYELIAELEKIDTLFEYMTFEERRLLDMTVNRLLSK